MRPCLLSHRNSRHYPLIHIQKGSNTWRSIVGVDALCSWHQSSHGVFTGLRLVHGALHLQPPERSHGWAPSTFIILSKTGSIWNNLYTNTGRHWSLRDSQASTGSWPRSSISLLPYSRIQTLTPTVHNQSLIASCYLLDYVRLDSLYWQFSTTFGTFVWNIDDVNYNNPLNILSFWCRLCILSCNWQGANCHVMFNVWWMLFVVLTVQTAQ